jgi:hypothetical protein
LCHPAAASVAWCGQRSTWNIAHGLYMSYEQLKLLRRIQSDIAAARAEHEAQDQCHRRNCPLTTALLG